MYRTSTGTVLRWSRWTPSVTLSTRSALLSSSWDVGRQERGGSRSRRFGGMRVHSGEESSPPLCRMSGDVCCPLYFMRSGPGLLVRFRRRRPRETILWCHTPCSPCRLTHQCAACQSSFPIHERAVAAPCGHQYHVDCMLTLVETSLQALSSFPPRCCRQTIPSEVFDRYLSRSLRSAYTERQAEYDCPKRVYCANPRCSLFLGSRDKRIPVRVLDCPSSSCDTRTCARCKTRVDGPTSRHECTHDPGYRATLQLGSRMGWVRCPACEELIERHGGCAHMTCVCGTEFCYRCRAEWKTCNCVDWGDGIGADDGEARLFAPLEEGGDLRPRLALWIPPILDRDEDATNRRESWVDVVPTPPPGPRPRPRSRSFVHTRPDSLAAYTAYFLDNTRPGRSSQVPASPKVSLLASRPPTLHLENDIAPYFPFLVDPELLARGIQAQETRRRRRAVSF
ncbi:hypothetical protein L227DRAFT_218934 [Lentinus tigrinus ALCF2SS1-6]|uniref:RBR-type E3 ubiquitin transferase n=1 Tax=Lentinus tigrinus ALCF2SS1-6 TaxID=1328759 RepID=A0A5C2SPX0_9APHY|nr:hypothetical protein L227DRAFT_218934 [Lentinus tigrinus ALCF2SS1-6]